MVGEIIHLFSASNTNYFTFTLETKTKKEKLQLPEKCAHGVCMSLHSTADGEAGEDGNNHVVVVPPTPLLSCHIAAGSVDAGVHRFTLRPTSGLLRPPAVGNFTGASRPRG